jgi:hypothetical protein
MTTLRNSVLVVGAALISVPFALAREICTSSDTHTFHVKVNLFASELGACRQEGSRCSRAARRDSVRTWDVCMVSPVVLAFLFFSFFFACVRVL